MHSTRLLVGVLIFVPCFLVRMLQDPTIHIRRTLLAIEAPYGECRGDLYFHDKRLYFLKKDENKELSDELAEVVQVLSILSALITTVTFA